MGEKHADALQLLVGERPFLLGFLQSRFHLFQDKARIMF
jgi:hypothetical protein